MFQRSELMLKDLLQGKPLRHPLHPILTHFPIGLFVLSFILDLISLGFPSVPNLARDAFYAIVLGIVTALIAAVPGLVDYADIRNDHPGKRTATIHLVLNLAIVAIYGINLGVRASTIDEMRTPIVPLVLSVIGLVLLSISGYLGGRLVYDDGIAVGRHNRRTATPQDTLHLSTVNGAKEADLVLVSVPGADRLVNGETLRAEIDGQIITIARLDNRVFAFQEFCTHRFGPLSEGTFDGFNVQCPWHKSCFDVRTGKVTNGPAKVELKTFRVETREGKICVGVPSAKKQL
jgi:uncharacterized membrane protein/nitrite reductase/ring-hydroxylating ferredoxin subunit